MKLFLKYAFFIFSCTQFAFAQHSVRKLPYPINTDVYDEICPILSYNENELFFTRVGSPDFNKTVIENGENLYKTMTIDRYRNRLSQIYTMIAETKVTNPITSSFNQDVWISHYQDGESYNLFHPSYPLNNALPNSICSHYGTDGAYLVINQFNEEGGVQAGFSIVKREDDITFTFPKPLHIQDFDKTGSEVNVSMSIDKEYIIMAMKRDDAIGDKDLYLSIKGYKGVYSTPINLGEILNSPYSEATPFFSQDKTKLYFASDRPGGYGGMDIYISDRLDYSFTKWSKPKLLGRPVNSKFDDSHPYVQLDENSMLFTSNRDGSSDIFFGFINRNDSLDFDIKVNVFIVKGEERKPINAQVYWSEAYKDNYQLFRVRDGKFHYTFKENIPMNFKAENRGYISDIVFLDPQELQNSGIKEIDIELRLEKGKGRVAQLKRPTFDKNGDIANDNVKSNENEIDSLRNRNKIGFIPLELNSTVVLKNIFFEKGHPDVLPTSFVSLVNLAELIKPRKDVIIQVEGHTDNVGDSQALMNLSLARANAIRVFLLDQGVRANQVKTKGFGASRPITKNRNEEERSKNRRVEIRILKQ
ncbi:MAG: OmpA family protein [Saprospiraceae bacterium]